MSAINVIGIPKALARPRAYRRGAQIGVYNQPNDWMSTVALAVMKDKPERVTCPCYLALTFRMPRLAKMPKVDPEHAKKPDLDNLIKATLDAMVPGWLDDDRLVIGISAVKRYAKVGEAPGGFIEITRLHGEVQS